MPLASADAHYRAQQRLQVAVLAAVESQWADIGEDLDAGWARVGPRMSALVAAGQVGAARDGVASVGDALAEQGITSRPAAAPNALRLAGVAYSLDGATVGSLDDLLYGAVVKARTIDGVELAGRLAAGRSFLRVVVPSQVADANRAASSVAIVARPKVGYVRLVNPPCCQRCAVLAGRFYRVASFQRHPRCDCRMVATSERYSDDAGYRIGPGDVKDLTRDQRQAIDAGADMNRVINAHRQSARSADGMTTAASGRRVLTPEGIYRVSATREEAVQRLIANGYLTP